MRLQGASAGPEGLVQCTTASESSVFAVCACPGVYRDLGLNLVTPWSSVTKRPSY